MQLVTTFTVGDWVKFGKWRGEVVELLDDDRLLKLRGETGEQLRAHPGEVALLVVAVPPVVRSHNA